jgi:hypothetical protein
MTTIYTTNTFSTATLLSLVDSDRVLITAGVAVGSYDVNAPTFVATGTSARFVVEGGIYNGNWDGIGDDGSAGSTRVSVGQNGWIEADD